MPKGIMIVQSQPADPGVEDAYNEWYRDTHIPDVLASPGIVGARRYRRIEAGRGAGPEVPGYIAVYDLDSDDLAATVAALGKRSADGGVTPADLIQMDPRPVVTVYELLD